MDGVGEKRGACSRETGGQKAFCRKERNAREHQRFLACALSKAFRGFRRSLISASAVEITNKRSSSSSNKKERAREREREVGRGQNVAEKARKEKKVDI